MAKYLVGILLLGMLACKSEPKSERDPLREMMQSWCTSPELTKAGIEEIGKEHLVIKNILHEYREMTNKLVKLGDPKATAIVQSHLKKVQQIMDEYLKQAPPE